MHKKRLSIVAATIVVLALTIYFVPPLRKIIRETVTTVTAQLSPAASELYPIVEVSQLTPDQVRILNLAREEYKKQPVSYDEHVLRYSEGNKEAWCADFVSWIMKETGHAYVNPHSGHWRIPGVYTLQEYYEAEKRYELVAGYHPQPGDVAFYMGRRTADLFSTSHVALVVKVDGNTMTTLGGNENGRLRLTTQKITAGENSLVGFGRLN